MGAAAFATSEPHIVNKAVTCSSWGIETKKCRPPPGGGVADGGGKARFAAGFGRLSGPALHLGYASQGLVAVICGLCGRTTRQQLPRYRSSRGGWSPQEAPVDIQDSGGPIAF